MSDNVLARVDAATSLAPARVPGIVLGTVQFGYPYGISLSRVGRGDVRVMLKRAWAYGIDMLDTAPVYGESEAIIGAEMPADTRFSFISKTTALRRSVIAREDVEGVIARARKSAADLRTRSFEAILVHESEDLVCQGSEMLMAGLRGLCEEGLTRRIGVSVYDPDVLDLILDRHRIDIVQLPLNVFDQRFIRDGYLSRLADRGIEVHVRSVFLQGLLLQAPADVSPRFAAAQAPLRRFRAKAEALGLTPAEAAILFASSQKGVSRLVVGVDSLASLDANAAALRKVAASSLRVDFGDYALDDQDVTDPRRWTR